MSGGEQVQGRGVWEGKGFPGEGGVAEVVPEFVGEEIDVLGFFEVGDGQLEVERGALAGAAGVEGAVGVVMGFVAEGEEEVGPAGVDTEVGVAGVEDETDFVFEAVQHGEKHVVELGEEAAVGTEMEDEGALEGIVEFAVEGEVHG